MRRGFTLVEIMIVILIIGMLLAIAVPGWVKMRTTSQEKACWENLRVIDDAKQQWAMDKGQPTGSTPTPADLVPEYLKKLPVCSGGGTLTIGSNDVKATDSVFGPSP